MELKQACWQTHTGVSVRSGCLIVQFLAVVCNYSWVEQHQTDVLRTRFSDWQETVSIGAFISCILIQLLLHLHWATEKRLQNEYECHILFLCCIITSVVVQLPKLLNSNIVLFKRNKYDAWTTRWIASSYMYVSQTACRFGLFRMHFGRHLHLIKLKLKCVIFEQLSSLNGTGKITIAFRQVNRTLPGQWRDAVFFLFVFFGG